MEHIWDHKKEDTEFFEKYKASSQGAFQSVRESCLSFGLEIGPGWHKILHEMMDRIYDLLDFFSIPREEFQLTQVKEKFGTLRVYWHIWPLGDKPVVERSTLFWTNISTFIGQIVSDAERMSSNTCEECGEYGSLRGFGWIYTSCKKHANEEDLQDWEKEKDQPATQESQPV